MSGRIEKRVCHTRERRAKENEKKSLLGMGTTHHDSLQTGGSVEAINKQPIYDELSDNVEKDTNRTILAGDDSTVMFLTSTTPAREDIYPPVLVGRLDETEAQVLMKSHSSVETDKGNKCDVHPLRSACADEFHQPYTTSVDEVHPLHTASVDEFHPLHAAKADEVLLIHTNSTYEVNSINISSAELLIKFFRSSISNLKLGGGG